MDFDPGDPLDCEAGGRAVRLLAEAEPALSPPPAERAERTAGTRDLLLVKLIAIAATLAVAAYGVETGRRSVAIAGLAATALVALVMALRACRSERARQELHLANERLRRTIAELDAFRLAVAQGFALIDDALDDPSEEAQ